MARLKAPVDLPELVRATFTKALAESAINYYPTQVAILHANSIPFQLRFSPALANKPKPPPKDPSKKPFDPFEDPPAAIKISDLGASHFLVLNKFAIVPEHFILATRSFKKQTWVLEEDDIAATMACIEAYEPEVEGGARGRGTGGNGGGLFAFFNGGEHSGASQPHRHIQLLPIARMKEDLPASSNWDILADSLPTARPPFLTFSERLQPGVSSSDLHATYLRLYRQACRAVSRQANSSDGEEEVPATGEARISYNMAMTKQTLVLVPRVSEGAEIFAQDGTKAGSLALNGTVLAGTALVKSEKEWDALRSNEAGLMKVLKSIGLHADDSGESKI